MESNFACDMWMKNMAVVNTIGSYQAKMDRG